MTHRVVMNTIRCPHCDSTIMVEVDHDGRATIECDETSCGAIWDAFGVPVRTPEQFQAEVAKIGAEYASGYAARKD